MFKFCWLISRSFPINIPIEHVFVHVFLFYLYFTNGPTKAGGDSRYNPLRSQYLPLGMSLDILKESENA